MVPRDTISIGASAGMERHRRTYGKRRSEIGPAQQTEIRELVEQYHDTGEEAMAHDFVEREIKE